MQHISAHHHQPTEHHHGNSPAAWTTVALVITGFLVGAFAFFAASPWIFAVGVGITVLGLVVGKFLAMAGYGVMPGYGVQEPAETSLEGPDLVRSGHDERSRT